MNNNGSENLADRDARSSRFLLTGAGRTRGTVGKLSML